MESDILMERLTHFSVKWRTNDGIGQWIDESQNHIRR